MDSFIGKVFFSRVYLFTKLDGYYHSVRWRTHPSVISQDENDQFLSLQEVSYANLFSSDSFNEQLVLSLPLNKPKGLLPLL